MPAAPTPWTADPFAARILASCAANPPRCIERRQRYAITADSWHEYVGRRADRLRAIRQQYGDRLLIPLVDRGEASFHDGGWPTVEEAIDAAVDAVPSRVDAVFAAAGGR